MKKQKNKVFTSFCLWVWAIFIVPFSMLGTNNSCEVPIITSFKIKDTIPNKDDDWTVDVVFEFTSERCDTKYLIIHDCFDFGYGYDYFIEPNKSEYTIIQVQKYATNYFRLFAFNDCGRSKEVEVTLPNISDSAGVETMKPDEVIVEVQDRKIFISNPLEKTVCLKLYSTQGSCVLSKAIDSGNHTVNAPANGFFILSLEVSGKSVMNRPILIK